jgi:hypothetical protein
MMKQIVHKSVVHLTAGMRVPNGQLRPLFFWNWATTNGPLFFALISMKKRATKGI